MRKKNMPVHILQQKRICCNQVAVYASAEKQYGRYQSIYNLTLYPLYFYEPTKSHNSTYLLSIYIPYLTYCVFTCGRFILKFQILLCVVQLYSYPFILRLTKFVIGIRYIYLVLRTYTCAYVMSLQHRNDPTQLRTISLFSKFKIVSNICRIDNIALSTIPTCQCILFWNRVVREKGNVMSNYGTYLLIF